MVELCNTLSLTNTMKATLSASCMVILCKIDCSSKEEKIRFLDKKGKHCWLDYTPFQKNSQIYVFNMQNDKCYKKLVGAVLSA